MLTARRSTAGPERRRRRPRVAAALAGLSVAVAGVSGATDVAGAAPADDTIELPLPYEVGQEASFVGTFTTAVDATVSGDSQTFALTMALGYDSTVTEVGDDGSAVVRSTFTSAEVLEGADDIDTSSIDDLVGVSYEEDYDADGTVTDRRVVDEESLTDEQVAAAEDFLTQEATTAVVFPDHPVAVGDTWTDETTIESQGVSIPATYTYELVDLSEQGYTISLSYDAAIDAEVAGSDVTGSVSGKGTIEGSRSNSLAMSVTVDQDVDMEFDGDEIHFGITVDLQAR